MSLHIIRALDAHGHTIGYLWRGKLVESAGSAKIYTSPSAAQRAIEQAGDLAAGWVVQPIRRTEDNMCAAAPVGQPDHMTPADLRAWQALMGYTQEAAAEALGMSLSGYKKLVGGVCKIDHRTALACAALRQGLRAWGEPR
jgi:hypothetical protein